MNDIERIKATYYNDVQGLAALYKERTKRKKNYQDIPTLLDYQDVLVDIGHKLIKLKYLARELNAHYDNLANSEYTTAMIQCEADKKQSTYAKSFANDKANTSRVYATEWEINYKKYRDMYEAIRNDQISGHSRYKYLSGLSE